MPSIGIFGANGRMGRALTTVAKEQQLHLTAATVRAGSELAGVDAGELAGVGKLGLPLSITGSDSIQNAGIWIDFTMPEAMLAQLELAVAAKKAMVIGVTGLSDEQYAKVQAASKVIPIVWAPNMSVGVNLLLHLVQTAAKVMGQSADIEIIEAHHRQKVDAPSGTALRLGGAVAKAAGLTLKENGVFHREGIMPLRKNTDIGFSTIRGGDIVGDHTVLFAGDGERIELTHKASSRKTFAKGAIRAAKFINDKTSGLFDILDVLNLKNID